MTTNHKVANLIGAELDGAVARAERRGLSFDIVDGRCLVDGHPFAPSTEWSLGGPIIEREHMALDYLDGEWGAWSPTARKFNGEGSDAVGPTPLIAAMRAYVTSKFGETVELP